MLYLLTLPWGLVGDLREWAIPASMLVGYFMLGIELIAEVIQDPFGTTADELMLDDICHTIERSVSDVLGDAPVEVAVEPVPLPNAS
jgi:putative membrane protein